MTIITQDGMLVNFEKVKSIIAVGGTIDDSDSEAFALFAFDVTCKYGNMDEYYFDHYSEGVYQLGIYESQAECEDMMNKIIAAIANDSRIMQMLEAGYSTAES